VGRADEVCHASIAPLISPVVFDNLSVVQDPVPISTASAYALSFVNNAAPATLTTVTVHLATYTGGGGFQLSVFDNSSSNTPGTFPG
jgi:hypothetical protein